MSCMEDEPYLNSYFNSLQDAVFHNSIKEL